jgi:YesN/AraC family two-component response regulator
MKKILVIDDEEPVRDVLKAALVENGYSVFEAENGKKGVEKFIDVNPDIIITDVNMPEMSGIDVTKKIKDMKSDADVVIMTGYGTEDLVVQSLRSGATNYIKKPVDFKELMSILDSLILKRENRRRFEVLKEIVVREEKTLSIGNNIAKIWGTVNQILFNLPQKIEEISVEGLKIGLYEILVNAIEHGNLGITYEEKKEALSSNTYNKLLKQRLKEADTAGKKVTIKSTFSRQQLQVEIEDEGNGFNYKELSFLEDPETLLSAHGRGILLASLYFDVIEYHGSGNSVTLIKRFNS